MHSGAVHIIDCPYPSFSHLCPYPYPYPLFSHTRLIALSTYSSVSGEVCVTVSFMCVHSSEFCILLMASLLSVLFQKSRHILDLEHNYVFQRRMQQAEQSCRGILKAAQG